VPAKLSDKAEHALNESRMLILGAQVLIGFDFNAVFQPAFERLPGPVQDLKVLGLALMLVAAGLLIAPGAFHQIAERGNDTPRLIHFTGHIASLALLPFALSIGLEVFIATQVVTGINVALAIGMAGTAFALFFWYALGWLWRARDRQLGQAREGEEMPEPTSLENRIKQVLTEARVVLPGAQALLGFQLAAMLTDAFGKLPQSSQYVHLASLVLLAVTMVLLMAPAAFHRIVEQGQDTERLHRFSSAMVLLALVPLGLGIAGDFYVVADRVLQSSTIAIALAGASLVFFFGLWFGLSFAVRSHARQAGRLRVSRAVR
jgi:uncharacterized protein DUF6328